MIEIKILIEKLDDAEKLHKILSERIEEFGTQTNKKFVSIELISHFVIQQEEVLEFLKQEKEKLNKENFAENTDVSYLGVLEVAQRRLNYIEEEFEKLHKKTLEFLANFKTFFSEKNFKENKIFFKSNEEIEFAKKTLEIIKAELIEKQKYEKKFNINVKLESNFETQLENQEQIKVLIDTKAILEKITDVFSLIEKEKINVDKLENALLKKDKDFFEEILKSKFFDEILKKSFKSLYELQSIEDETFLQDILNKFEKEINLYTETLKTIENLYDSIFVIPEIEKHIGKQCEELNILYNLSKNYRDFLYSTLPEEVFEKAFYKHGNLIDKFKGFFLSGDDNIEINNLDNFLILIEKYGSDKISNETKSIIYIKKIIDCINYFDSIYGFSYLQLGYIKQIEVGIKKFTGISDYYEKCKLTFNEVSEIKSDYEKVIGFIKEYKYSSSHSLKSQTDKLLLIIAKTNFVKLEEDSITSLILKDFSKRFYSKKSSYESARRSSSSSSSSRSSGSSSSRSSGSSSSSSSYSSSGGSSW